MRYKIAICDDCDVDRQYILNMVTLWGERSGHIVHIDTFSSAVGEKSRGVSHENKPLLF